ncbi:YcjF family protein [Aestuariibius sp. 2305UL40-4]|uniref:YcjF family protein n=1 Tax=Aestuariibius violaceus TaxID=3234132 RepID=UPI00345E1B8F
MSKGPVLIDLDDRAADSPASAPPVPDLTPTRPPAAMEQAARLAAARPSPLARWFWSLLVAIVTFALGVAAWDFVTGLIARNAILGAIATALLTAFLLVLAALALREAAALFRLRRIDDLHQAADAAIAAADLTAARAVTADLARLYAGRPDTAWGRDRLEERKDEPLDADALLGLAETTLLAPLDARARREVEAAARQVATVTAIVPLALADVFTALTANLRMIRRIAEIYGGRSGALGGWRLTRAVLSHLVATGAVAVGDDLISSVAGGGVLSRVSRRFGEGIINGALTARVGVAAIEVCRPLPFLAERRPSVTNLVKRALTGLFGGAKE